MEFKPRKIRQITTQIDAELFERMERAKKALERKNKIPRIKWNELFSQLFEEFVKANDVKSPKT